MAWTNWRRFTVAGLLAAPLAVAPACVRVGDEAAYARARERMVTRTIEERGVRDPGVLAAMRKVPRHLFLPKLVEPSEAYGDFPRPLGHGQTMSQPYIVALMTELAELTGKEKVLEVGAGSGYGAAVLAEVAGEVYSVEILEVLAHGAAKKLKAMGYRNVKVRAGDGYRGWAEAAPFDAIVVTAAPPRIPEPLKQQLAPGGRLVLPVGEDYQELVVVTRTPDGFQTRRVVPVRFVPMTGEVQEQR